jgi:hypothetical protein
VTELAPTYRPRGAPPTPDVPTRRLAAVLLLAGAAGALAVIPLILSVQGDVLRQLGADLRLVAVVTVVQTTLMVALAVLAGLTLGRRIRLGAPLLESLLARRPADGRSPLPGAVLLGAVTAAVIVGLDLAVPNWQPAGDRPSYPLWQGLLAGVYGGVTEELLLRFGLFTTLAFVLWRIRGQRADQVPAATLWTVNVIVAVAFALLHLPATVPLGDLTTLVVLRTLVLNGVGGLVFGYLYWRRGLEAAIAAHFTADIVIQVAVWRL